MLVIVGSVRTVLAEVQSVGSIQLFESDSCVMRAGGGAALQQR